MKLKFKVFIRELWDDLSLTIHDHNQDSFCIQSYRTQNDK